MAALKRLAVAVLALTFLVGLTAQTVVRASMAVGAMSGSLATTDVPGHPANPENPCGTPAQDCSDHGGCLVLVALPLMPGSVPVPVNWAAVEYRELASSLTGHFIRPELSPPIPAA